MSVDQVTQIDDIPPVTVVVELPRLKTRSGEPVRVLVERMSESEFVALVGLPALDPKLGLEAPVDPQALLEFMPKVRAVVQRCTALRRADGTFQRPAFWFDQPVEGAYPGRFLSDLDLTELMTAVNRLMTGGALSAVEFRDDDGARGDDRAGAALPGEGVPDAAS